MGINCAAFAESLGLPTKSQLLGDGMLLLAAVLWAATTLVISPTVTVCSACHDTADAISHYKINGGAFYQPRSSAITGSNETCLVCHGTGRVADIATMHSKNR